MSKKNKKLYLIFFVKFKGIFDLLLNFRGIFDYFYTKVKYVCVFMRNSMKYFYTQVRL